MDMSFGKYEGKSVAWVFLEDSQYFTWMDSNGQSWRPEFTFAIQLVAAFDAIPLNSVKCHGDCRGHNPVTRLALYDGNYNGQYWFCDKCDPYTNGAISGKLAFISKLSQVIGYKDSQSIIKAMAIAKGVPQRKTSKALKDFFGY